MDQRYSVITIAAEDVTAMRSFYEGILGWQPVAVNNDIAFYKLNGMLLSVCSRTLLTDFIATDFHKGPFCKVTFGYNVQNADEVRSIYSELKDKVKIIKEPTEPPFGGLFFYLADIEDNLIEIAYNPFVTLDHDRNAVDHKPISHL